jgi:hypothetical protein
VRIICNSEDWPPFNISISIRQRKSFGGWIVLRADTAPFCTESESASTSSYAESSGR